MSALDWLMVASGAFVLLLGLIAAIGWVTGVGRHEGRGPMVAGVGMILAALAGVSGEAAEPWVAWAGAACVVAGGVLMWRSHRRERSPVAAPAAHGRALDD